MGDTLGLISRSYESILTLGSYISWFSCKVRASVDSGLS